MSMSRPYVVEKVEHGTPSWHELRLRYIGCSELAALFNKSPFLTRKKLGEIKKGQYTIPDNPYMARGRALEPYALDCYNQMHCRKLKPMVLKSKNKRLIASMDGFDEMLQIGVEIKCPTLDKHNHFMETQEIPEHYWIQIQGQLFVTGAQYIDYVSFYKDDESGQVSIGTKKVASDYKFQEQIPGHIENFFYQLKNDSISNYPTVMDPNLRRLMSEYKTKVFALNRIQEEVDALKKKIQESAKQESGSFKRIEFYYQERKGAVDYAQIPELKNIDLEKYRKPGTKFFVVKIPND